MKKIALIVLAVIAFLAVFVVIAETVVENKVEKKLNQALGPQSSFKNVDVDLLRRAVVIKDLEYHSNGKTVIAPKVAFEGISLYQYIFNDRIKVGDAIITSPEILVRKKDSAANSREIKRKRSVYIENFRASNGLFKLKKKDSAGNDLFIRFPELQVSQVKVDSSTLNGALPFHYKSYHLRADSLRVNLNPEHFIAVSYLDIDDGKTLVRDFRIVPYYSKTDFDRQIPYEKDRISLRVDSIELKDLKFHFEQDTLYLKNPLTTISSANLEIYRNKALPDDLRKRTLYSEKLRNSPVKLDLEQVKLVNSKIEYQERVRANTPLARVTFHDLDADIRNIRNVNLGEKNFPKTKVDANALFQNETPITLDWSFDVTNPEEKFYISGEFGRIPDTALEPLLRAREMAAEGAIKEALFTFTGNEDFLLGDVQASYEKFRIIMLEDDGAEKEGFFTAIANLFVDNDGVSGKKAVEEIRVERVKNRSFWNFVWKGLQQGTKDLFSQI